MPKINLSDIQSAADTQFGPFEVSLPGDETAYFVPVLRLPKAKRVELSAALDLSARAEEEGTDVYDLYLDAFRITAKGAEDFDKLSAAVGDDPAVWQALFQAYSEETQVGEA